MLKKTKIICTIGPASEPIEKMSELVKNGMNVIRMNFSHGDYEEQGARIKTIRQINRETGSNVGLLLDTKGPEMRTHRFCKPEKYVEGKAYKDYDTRECNNRSSDEDKAAADFNDDIKYEVKAGSKVIVAMEQSAGVVLPDFAKFSVSYPGLYDDVKIGGKILIDDGYLSLTVKEKDEKKRELICVADNSHKLKSKRGVNVPGAYLQMPFISAKDKADIEFAADQDLDYIAASFVRRPSDVQEIRNILKAKGNTSIQIIAKIENQEGVDNMEAILDVADGIMVARGDLGVEVDAWEVPVIQKKLVEMCQRKGKIVVVATQMLETMQDNPRPTRAEVSDVANAVREGCDSTMLSGETAAGKYPETCVYYMANIQKRMMPEMDYEKLFNNAVEGHDDTFVSAFAMDAAKMAMEYKNVAAIITLGGKDMARAVSKFRPAAPIIATVPQTRDARALALNYAVYPVLGDEKDAIKFIKANIEDLKNKVAIVVAEDSIKIVNL